LHGDLLVRQPPEHAVEVGEQGRLIGREHPVPVFGDERPGDWR